MSERRECFPHRGCCRIVMLVASGPAFSGQALDAVHSLCLSVRIRLSASSAPAISSGRSRRRSGPVRRMVGFRRNFPFRLAVPKPLRSLFRHRAPKSVCHRLPSAIFVPPGKPGFPVSLPAGSGLVDDSAPLTATAVRQVCRKTPEACFPLLLRASLPPSRRLKFPVLFQGVSPSRVRDFGPLDDLKLRLRSESHKQIPWKLSTVRRNLGGQACEDPSAARIPRCTQSRRSFGYCYGPFPSSLQAQGTPPRPHNGGCPPRRGPLFRLSDPAVPEAGAAGRSA